MSIKILDKTVINQISAGEVVEKPASVVKELVENSLDAGATEIIVEIKKGGIDYISIQDNGCGIKSNEIKLAFTPHATSKLEKLDDLNTLATMGFRGEALATISAISKVTITTKTAETDIGTQVKLEGGEEVSSTDIASINGTKIQVENIFYNTPARLKFLRKPKTEENDITNYIEKLILGNCNISFKYIVDGKLIYNTFSSSLIDNIYTIYGKDIADNMLKVDYSINGYSVSGYISKPEYSKSNRTYQNLFVNNRFCSNALISTAISNAYESFSMKGKFPIFVLFLTLPQNELDVNVHPNKLEVKFENTQLIYRVFNDAVFKALSDFNHVREVKDLNSEYDNKLLLNESSNNTLSQLSENEGVSFSSDQKNQYEDLLNKYAESCLDILSPKEYVLKSNNSVLPEVELDNVNVSKPVFTEKFSDFIKQEKISQNDFKDVLSLDYIFVGVAFNTYLIIEYNNNLYLIDQHAAHERKKYDEIMNQINNNNLKIQSLLVPYILKVNQTEANFFDSNLDKFIEFGIDICEFGYNTYKISSVPMILADLDLSEFFSEILNNLNAMLKSPQETIKAKLMQMACKSAVKGGDRLSDLEIKSLLNSLKNEIDVLLCPHGRPIVVEISKKQIEKWFKRIV